MMPEIPRAAAAAVNGAESASVLPSPRRKLIAIVVSSINRVIITIITFIQRAPQLRALIFSTLLAYIVAPTRLFGVSLLTLLLLSSLAPLAAPYVLAKLTGVSTRRIGFSGVRDVHFTGSPHSRLQLVTTAAIEWRVELLRSGRLGVSLLMEAPRIMLKQGSDAVDSPVSQGRVMSLQRALHFILSLMRWGGLPMQRAINALATRIELRIHGILTIQATEANTDSIGNAEDAAKWTITVRETHISFGTDGGASIHALQVALTRVHGAIHALLSIPSTAVTVSVTRHSETSHQVVHDEGATLFMNPFLHAINSAPRTAAGDLLLTTPSHMQARSANASTTESLAINFHISFPKQDSGVHLSVRRSPDEPVRLQPPVTSLHANTVRKARDDFTTLRTIMGELASIIFGDSNIMPSFSLRVDETAVSCEATTADRIAVRNPVHDIHNVSASQYRPHHKLYWTTVCAGSCRAVTSIIKPVPGIAIRKAGVYLFVEAALVLQRCRSYASICCRDVEDSTLPNTDMPVSNDAVPVLRRRRSSSASASLDREHSRTHRQRGHKLCHCGSALVSAAAAIAERMDAACTANVFIPLPGAAVTRNVRVDRSDDVGCAVVEFSPSFKVDTPVVRTHAPSLIACLSALFRAASVAPALPSADAIYGPVTLLADMLDIRRLTLKLLPYIDVIRLRVRLDRSPSLSFNTSAASLAFVLAGCTLSCPSALSDADDQQEDVADAEGRDEQQHFATAVRVRYTKTSARDHQVEILPRSGLVCRIFECAVRLSDDESDIVNVNADDATEILPQGCGGFALPILGSPPVHATEDTRRAHRPSAEVPRDSMSSLQVLRAESISVAVGVDGSASDRPHSNNVTALIGAVDLDGCAVLLSTEVIKIACVLGADLLQYLKDNLQAAPSYLTRSSYVLSSSSLSLRRVTVAVITDALVDAIQAPPPPTATDAECPYHALHLSSASSTYDPNVRLAESTSNPVLTIRYGEQCAVIVLQVNRLEASFGCTESTPQSDMVISGGSTGDDGRANCDAVRRQYSTSGVRCTTSVSFWNIDTRVCPTTRHVERIMHALKLAMVDESGEAARTVSDMEESSTRATKIVCIRAPTSVRLVWSLDDAPVQQPMSLTISAGDMSVDWSPAMHVLLLQAWLMICGWRRLWIAPLSTPAVTASTAEHGSSGAKNICIDVASTDMIVRISARTSLHVMLGGCALRGGDGRGHVLGPDVIDSELGPVAALRMSTASIRVIGFSGDDQLLRAADICVTLGSTVDVRVLSFVSREIKCHIPRTMYFGDVTFDAREVRRILRVACSLVALDRSRIASSSAGVRPEATAATAAVSSSPAEAVLHRRWSVSLRILRGIVVEMEEIDGAVWASHEMARRTYDIAASSAMAAAVTSGVAVNIDRAVDFFPVSSPPPVAIITVSTLDLCATVDGAGKHSFEALCARFASLDDCPDTVVGNKSTSTSFDTSSLFGTNMACRCSNPLAHGLRDVDGATVSLDVTGLKLSLRGRDTILLHSSGVRGEIIFVDLLPPHGTPVRAVVGIKHLSSVRPHYALPLRGPFPSLKSHSMKESNHTLVDVGVSAVSAIPAIALHTYRVPPSAASATKVFYDLDIVCDGLHVRTGPAYEADVVAFSEVMSRCVPSSILHAYAASLDEALAEKVKDVGTGSDSSGVVSSGSPQHQFVASSARPRSMPLRWWDRARYFAHGILRLHVKDARIAVVCHPPVDSGSRDRTCSLALPDVSSEWGLKLVADVLELITYNPKHDERGDQQHNRSICRVAANTSGVRLHVLVGPAYGVNTQAEAAASAGFPVIQLPNATIAIAYTWHTRDGAHPARHYVHLPAPAGSARALHAELFTLSRAPATANPRSVTSVLGSTPMQHVFDEWVSFRATGFDVCTTIQCLSSVSSLVGVKLAPPPDAAARLVVEHAASVAETNSCGSNATAAALAAVSPASQSLMLLLRPKFASRPLPVTPATIPCNSSASKLIDGATMGEVPRPPPLPAHATILALPAVTCIALEGTTCSTLFRLIGALRDTLPVPPMSPIDAGVDIAAVPTSSAAVNGIFSLVRTFMLNVKVGDADGDHTSPGPLSVAYWNNSRQPHSLGSLLRARQADITWHIVANPPLADLPRRFAGYPHTPLPMSSADLPRLPSGFEVVLKSASLTFAPILPSVTLRARQEALKRWSTVHSPHEDAVLWRRCMCPQTRTEAERALPCTSCPLAYSILPHPLRLIRESRAAMRCDRVAWAVGEAAAWAAQQAQVRTSSGENSVFERVFPEADVAALSPLSTSSHTSMINSIAMPQGHVVFTGLRHIWSVQIRDTTLRLIDDFSQLADARTQLLGERPLSQSTSADPLVAARLRTAQIAAHLVARAIFTRIAPSTAVPISLDDAFDGCVMSLVHTAALSRAWQIWRECVNEFATEVLLPTKAVRVTDDILRGSFSALTQRYKTNAFADKSSFRGQANADTTLGATAALHHILFRGGHTTAIVDTQVGRCIVLHAREGTFTNERAAGAHLHGRFVSRVAQFTAVSVFVSSGSVKSIEEVPWPSSVAESGSIAIHVGTINRLVWRTDIASQSTAPAIGDGGPCTVAGGISDIEKETVTTTIAQPVATYVMTAPEFHTIVNAVRHVLLAPSLPATIGESCAVSVLQPLPWFLGASAALCNDAALEQDFSASPALALEFLHLRPELLASQNLARECCSALINPVTGSVHWRAINSCSYVLDSGYPTVCETNVSDRGTVTTDPAWGSFERMLHVIATTTSVQVTSNAIEMGTVLHSSPPMPSVVPTASLPPLGNKEMRQMRRDIVHRDTLFAAAVRARILSSSTSGEPRRITVFDTAGPASAAAANNESSDPSHPDTLYTPGSDGNLRTLDTNRAPRVTENSLNRPTARTANSHSDDMIRNSSLPPPGTSPFALMAAGLLRRQVNARLQLAGMQLPASAALQDTGRGIAFPVAHRSPHANLRKAAATELNDATIKVCLLGRLPSSTSFWGCHIAHAASRVDDPARASRTSRRREIAFGIGRLDLHLLPAFASRPAAMRTETSSQPGNDDGGNFKLPNATVAGAVLSATVVALQVMHREVGGPPPISAAINTPRDAIHQRLRPAGRVMRLSVGALSVTQISPLERVSGKHHTTHKHDDSTQVVLPVKAAGQGAAPSNHAATVTEIKPAPASAVAPSSIAKLDHVSSRVGNGIRKVTTPFVPRVVVAAQPLRRTFGAGVSLPEANSQRAAADAFLIVDVEWGEHLFPFAPPAPPIGGGGQGDVALMQAAANTDAATTARGATHKFLDVGPDYRVTVVEQLTAAIFPAVPSHPIVIDVSRGVAEFAVNYFFAASSSDIVVPVANVNAPKTSDGTVPAVGPASADSSARGTDASLKRVTNSGEGDTRAPKPHRRNLLRVARSFIVRRLQRGRTTATNESIIGEHDNSATRELARSASQFSTKNRGSRGHRTPILADDISDTPQSARTEDESRRPIALTNESGSSDDREFGSNEHRNVNEGDYGEPAALESAGAANLARRTVGSRSLDDTGSIESSILGDLVETKSDGYSTGELGQSEDQADASLQRQQMPPSLRALQPASSSPSANNANPPASPRVRPIRRLWTSAKSKLRIPQRFRVAVSGDASLRATTSRAENELPVRELLSKRSFRNAAASSSGDGIVSDDELSREQLSTTNPLPTPTLQRRRRLEKCRHVLAVTAPHKDGQAPNIIPQNCVSCGHKATPTVDECAANPADAALRCLRCGAVVHAGCVVSLLSPVPQLPSRISNDDDTLFLAQNSWFSIGVDDADDAASIPDTDGGLGVLLAVASVAAAHANHVTASPPVPQLIFLRHVVMPNIVLMLSLSGYYRMSLIRAPIVLKGLELLDALIPWSGLAAVVRRHFRSQVWSVVPKLLRAAMQTAAAAGLGRVAAMAAGRPPRANGSVDPGSARKAAATAPQFGAMDNEGIEQQPHDLHLNHEIRVRSIPEYDDDETDDDGTAHRKLLDVATNLSPLRVGGDIHLATGNSARSVTIGPVTAVDEESARRIKRDPEGWVQSMQNFEVSDFSWPATLARELTQGARECTGDCHATSVAEMPTASTLCTSGPILSAPALPLQAYESPTLPRSAVVPSTFRTRMMASPPQPITSAARLHGLTLRVDPGGNHAAGIIAQHAVPLLRAPHAPISAWDGAIRLAGTITSSHPGTTNVVHEPTAYASPDTVDFKGPRATSISVTKVAAGALSTPPSIIQQPLPPPQDVAASMTPMMVASFAAFVGGGTAERPRRLRGGSVGNFAKKGYVAAAQGRSGSRSPEHLYVSPPRGAEWDDDDNNFADELSPQNIDAENVNHETTTLPGHILKTSDDIDFGSAIHKVKGDPRLSVARTKGPPKASFISTGRRLISKFLSPARKIDIAHNPGLLHERAAPATTGGNLVDTGSHDSSKSWQRVQQLFKREVNRGPTDAGHDPSLTSANRAHPFTPSSQDDSLVITRDGASVFSTVRSTRAGGDSNAQLLPYGPSLAALPISLATLRDDDDVVAAVDFGPLTGSEDAAACGNENLRKHHSRAHCNDTQSVPRSDLCTDSALQSDGESSVIGSSHSSDSSSNFDSSADEDWTTTLGLGEVGSLPYKIFDANTERSDNADGGIAMDAQLSGDSEVLGERLTTSDNNPGRLVDGAQPPVSPLGANQRPPPSMQPKREHQPSMDNPPPQSDESDQYAAINVNRDSEAVWLALPSVVPVISADDMSTFSAPQRSQPREADV